MVRIFYRLIALAWIAALVPSWAGCLHTPDEDLPFCLHVEIQAQPGQSIGAYSITADDVESGTGAIWCPGADIDPPSEDCARPMILKNLSAGSVLTVRAPGFRNESIILSPAEMPTTDDGCRKLDVTLRAAPEIDRTEDYVTGFTADDGIDSFVELGVLTPTGYGTLVAVKFFIDDINGSPVVYFQNTRKHPLHFNFVRGVLGKSLTSDEYEASTYHGLERTAMAGNIVWYRDFSVNSRHAGAFSSPMTVEFFPSDDLTPAQALKAYDLIHERIRFLAPGGQDNRLAYSPATADHETDLADSDAIFENSGALWLTRQDLFGGATMQLLNRGTAFGRLIRMTPEELRTTVVSWKDIVLLTELPIEAPLVGGFITEQMQTPLSHVNVAAMNRGTPNMALVGASEHPDIKPFIWPGQGGDGSGVVRYEVTATGFSLEWSTMEEAEAFWKDARPDGLEVPQADIVTEGLIDFADLGFADSLLVGAKAANLAECRKVIGDITPDGMAVPFFYYNGFIESAVFDSTLCDDAESDCIEEGRMPATCQEAAEFCRAGSGGTLAAYIDALLADATFESDSTFREASLDGLRYLIGHIPVEPVFAALLDESIASRWPSSGVRLRSSTNAEDLAAFSGAGLYESVGADTGTRRPSDRIRKVWASVWNWRAFEERSFMGLRHSDVKMAVAVHKSFPTELANGVLITRNIADASFDGFYVNVQVGETSVTNPEDGSLPEVFVMTAAGGSLEVVRSRMSSLSPESPIMTREEMGQLYSAARKLHDHFRQLYRGNPATFALDIEFKLDSPDRRLVIKQARPYAFKY